MRLLTCAIVAFALAVSATTGYALRSSAAAPADDDRPRVVATTTFLADTVRQVGGTHVDVTGLMPPGVDPHLYRAKASDLDLLREADAVFAVGLHLEGAMQQTLTSLGGETDVLFAGEHVPRQRLLRPNGAPDGSGFDPHVWLDPQLWTHVVDAVGAELAELDPARADAYRERARRYAAEVTAAGEQVRSTLAQLPRDRRVLVTSHDAFRYFGRAYGFEVSAIQGISTDQEASTADVARVTDTVVDAGVPAVFVESSVPARTLDAVLAAARQRGHDVAPGGALYADATGPDGSYLGMLQHNADQLVAGLS